MVNFVQDGRRQHRREWRDEDPRGLSLPSRYDAARAIENYKAAFGATESVRLEAPDGRIGHAELAFGEATVMLADEFPEVGITAPVTLNGTSFTVHLHVDDADAAVRRAVHAGAEVTMQPTAHFYGERTGVVRDPFGHRWTLVTASRM